MKKYNTPELSVEMLEAVDVIANSSESSTITTKSKDPYAVDKF